MHCLKARKRSPHMAEKPQITKKIEECNCYNGNMFQILKVTQSLLRKYSKILKQ